MLDNIYLESVLKPWSSLKQVTSIDQLSSIKNITNFPSSFIVNTRPFPQAGHWIALIFTKNFHCIYFDSLGPSMSSQISEIQNFINSNSLSLELNLHPIQSLSSVYCGFFCIAKIISNMLKEDQFTFVQHFSTNLDDNDVIVLKLIKSFSIDLLK